MKKKPLTPQMKEQKLRRFLIRGIALSSVCFFSSLTLTVFPKFPQTALSGIRRGITAMESGLEHMGASISAAAGRCTTTAHAAEPVPLAQSSSEPVSSVQPAASEAASEAAVTEDKDPDIVTDPVSEADAVYHAVLPTALGPMIYYHQGDARWRDYLYGGSDPMHTYGCGPTVAAMLINSFSPQQAAVIPVDLADWSAAHGHYAPSGGSYRSLIPDAMSSYGLNVASVKDRSAANVSSLLSSGHVLVALMGRGTFTQSGHFIIITQIADNNMVSIADPNSMEHSEMQWDLNLILNELKKVSDSGAPLWSVSR